MTEKFYNGKFVLQIQQPIGGGIGTRGSEVIHFAPTDTRTMTMIAIPRSDSPLLAIRIDTQNTEQKLFLIERHDRDPDGEKKPALDGLLSSSSALISGWHDEHDGITPSRWLQRGVECGTFGEADAITDTKPSIVSHIVETKPDDFSPRAIRKSLERLKDNKLLTGVEALDNQILDVMLHALAGAEEYKQLSDLDRNLGLYAELHPPTASKARE